MDETYVEAIEGMVVVGHAKKIKEYCKSQKDCMQCVFHNGTCSLSMFHPEDWDFKNYGQKER